MSISLEWQKALTVIGRAEAALSFFGSAWICQHVLLSAKKQERVYHRLLLGMSFGELIKSIVRFCLQWFVPAEEYGWWGARGTRFTCIMQGFVLQLSLVSSLYNAGLSLYCLFTIRYGWSERKTARQLEPWVHGLSWAIALGQAVVGIPLKLYNSFGFVCFIGPWPPGCTESWKSPDGEGTCERGDNATLYTVFFFQAWDCAAFLCTAVSMFSVYWRLRHHENRIQRYDFSRQFTIQQQREQQSEESGRRNFFGRRSATMPALNRKNSHRFAMQALLYVSVFYVSHMFTTCWSVHNMITGGSLFWLVLLAAVTAQIEGFLNFLVYIRPKYIRLREERKELPAWRVIIQIVGGNSTAALNPSPRRQTHPVTVAENKEQKPAVLDLQRAEEKADDAGSISPARNHDSPTVPEGAAQQQEHAMDGRESPAGEGEGEHFDEY